MNTKHASTSKQTCLKHGLEMCASFLFMACLFAGLPTAKAASPSDASASAAAPTAGLHFTPELMAKIVAKGVTVETVELVVGLDTFKPISADDPLDHLIHSEFYSVDQRVMDACRDAKRVIAVGTTATRALESVAASGQLSGRTSLFITPGFEWKVVDLMLTNFHLPKTSLLLMIESFIGPRWRDIYAEAISEQYRFLSFGDAMLLARS